MTQSSKTEVLGFDEWFKNMGYMDGYQHHYQDAYDTGHEAGAASRQAEIDELQKRIGRAMKYTSESPLKGVSRKAMINFLDILKGKQDD